MDLMADIDPAIAKKVLAADVRNLVKKVGDGGTLSNVDRQIFLEMAEGTTSPDQIREARISALMRKWMDGGRLSLSERDEIAHLLPEASMVNTEGMPLPQQPGALVEDDVLRIYDISRAKYFRWKQAGAAVPEGPDPPPFDEPAAMVAWYERMRGRDIFKHKCPRVLHDLAAKGLPSRQASPTAHTLAEKQATLTAKHQSTSSQAPNHSQHIPEEERGFLVELEKQEIKTARERRAADEAFANNDLQAYALLNSEHRSSLELLRKMQTQKESVALAEKSMIKTVDLIELQGQIVRNIIRGLSAPHLLQPLYTTLNLTASGISFEVFIAAQAAHVRDCFGELVRSNLAEPYALAAA
jgi:hypothetical protein